MNKDALQRAIAGATTPVYPSSFSDVASGFKEKYGARGWTSQLAQVISGTSDKQNKEYKAALRNVQRYEKGTHNPERAKAPIKAAIATAGQTLNPVSRNVPARGITIEVRFKAPEDKGHAPRERVAKVEMSSGQAYQFVNSAPLGDITYADFFDEWFDDGGDTYGEDGDYEADVTGVSAY